MTKSRDSSHTVSRLTAHLVWVTKYRYHILKGDALVDRILELKKTGKDTQSLENEIDALVYRLYDITPEEQAIIEGT